MRTVSSIVTAAGITILVVVIIVAIIIVSLLEQSALIKLNEYLPEWAEALVPWNDAYTRAQD